MTTEPGAIAKPSEPGTAGRYHRMTGAEQAKVEPPSCSKCGSEDTVTRWVECTQWGDRESYFLPMSLDCNSCHAQGMVFR